MYYLLIDQFTKRSIIGTKKTCPKDRNKLIRKLFKTFPSFPHPQQDLQKKKKIIRYLRHRYTVREACRDTQKHNEVNFLVLSSNLPKSPPPPPSPTAAYKEAIAFQPLPIFHRDSASNTIDIIFFPSNK